FSDMSLDEDGQLQPGDLSDWFGDYFGREGGVLLVNGKVVPTLRGRAGAPQRWRVVNAARARFLKMTIPGVPMVRVGGDAGGIEHPQPLDELELAPSERAEILVTPPTSDLGEIEVDWKDADRFDTGLPLEDLPLLRYAVSTEPAVVPPALPDPLRSISPIDTSGVPTRPIELGEDTVEGEGVPTINGETFEEAAPHVAYVGDTEIWEVSNTTPYHHPFHLHGFSFHVLDVDGVSWPVREWKDTVNVAGGETLRVAVTFDDRPGSWMFHCHILDHTKLGMMAVLDVEPAP
ncbi:MAG: multicopper oxidase family protein, partial [Myxococcota bacterium]